jgi:hypothetical protein
MLVNFRPRMACQPASRALSAIKTSVSSRIADMMDHIPATLNLPMA